MDITLGLQFNKINWITNFIVHIRGRTQAITHLGTIYFQSGALTMRKQLQSTFWYYAFIFELRQSSTPDTTKRCLYGL